MDVVLSHILTKIDRIGDLLHEHGELLRNHSETLDRIEEHARRPARYELPKLSREAIWAIWLAGLLVLQVPLPVAVDLISKLLKAH
jgi:hypothetical protein